MWRLHHSSPGTAIVQGMGDKACQFNVLLNMMGAEEKPFDRRLLTVDKRHRNYTVNGVLTAHRLPDRRQKLCATTLPHL